MSQHDEVAQGTLDPAIIAQATAAARAYPGLNIRCPWCTHSVRGNVYEAHQQRHLDEAEAAQHKESARMIVVIEGIDASGKATQSKRLAERLKGKRFAFPNYETPTGQAILGHLKREWNAAAASVTVNLETLLSNIGPDGGVVPVPVDLEGARRRDALVFQCLQTTNRLETLPALLAALQDGPVVLDRYWQSAVVYGALDGLARDWLRLVQERPMPPADVHLLLDVPVEETWMRRPERRDRYETDREYLEKVRQGYLRLWGEMSMRHPGLQDYTVAQRRWRVVDGVGDVAEVAQRIDQAIADVVAQCGVSQLVSASR